MIELKNIERRWVKFALQEINFAVQPKEIFGIWGHNGAGKTLLLETIAGFWKPDKGKILIEGVEVTETPPENRGVGFVYQSPLLFPHLSVKENICYSLRIKKVPSRLRERKLDEVSEELRLKELLSRKNINFLSGGEKQKVALARVLINQPRVLLLDEPTHSLDQGNRELFYWILRKLIQKRKLSIIFVSHDYSELKSLVKKIAIMEKGKFLRIEEENSPV